MKKIIGLVFSFALMLGLVFPTTADAARVDFNPIVMTSKNADYSFTVPGGKGHVKLFFKNLGSLTAEVTVKHKDTGKKYMNGVQISPNNNSITFFSNEENPQGMRSGEYVVNVSVPSNGSEPNVQFFGFATDNVSDLK